VVANTMTYLVLRAKAGISCSCVGITGCWRKNGAGSEGETRGGEAPGMNHDALSTHFAKSTISEARKVFVTPEEIF